MENTNDIPVRLWFWTAFSSGFAILQWTARKWLAFGLELVAWEMEITLCNVDTCTITSPPFFSCLCVDESCKGSAGHYWEFKDTVCGLAGCKLGLWKR